MMPKQTRTQAQYTTFFHTQVHSTRVNIVFISCNKCNEHALLNAYTHSAALDGQYDLMFFKFVSLFYAHGLLNFVSRPGHPPS